MYFSYIELCDILYVRTPSKYWHDCKKTSTTEGVNILVLHIFVNSRIQLVQVEAAVISNTVAITDSDCIIRDGCERLQRLYHT